MKVLQSLLLIPLTLAFIILPVCAETTVEGEIHTVRGKLEVLREVKSPDSFPDYRVVIDGQTVIESDSQIKSIVASYPENAPAKLILIQIVSGGSGCPYSHSVIEVKEIGKVIVSDGIESCFLIAGKPVLKTDGWVIHFYPAGGLYTDTWIYQNGKVFEASALRIKVPK